MYQQTKCSYCGTLSRNFRPGNVCHGCLRGIMQAV